MDAQTSVADTARARRARPVASRGSRPSEGYASARAARRCPRCSTRTASWPRATAWRRGWSTRSGERVPVAEQLDQALAVGRGHARDLHCGPELERARGLLATPGSGRQRELAREHGPEGMVAALADLFLASRGLSPAGGGKLPIRRQGSPEADPQQRAAAGGVGRLDEAAVRLGGLAHDRQPEPRARHAARAVGAVEALEHVRQVAPRRSPGRGRARSARRRARPTSTAPPGGLHLTRVVEQVRHRALDPLGLAAHDRRLGVELERRRRRPRARRARSTSAATISSSRTSSSRLAALGARAPARPRRPPARSARRARSTMSARSASRSCGGQAVGVLERLDVRAQAGDRRAQLVAGVGHEVALGLDRALERVERRVEAAREPGRARRRPPPPSAAERSGSRGELLGAAREARRSAPAPSRATSAPSAGAERDARPRPRPAATSRTRRAGGRPRRAGARPAPRRGRRQRAGEHAQVRAVDASCRRASSPSPLARDLARARRPPAAPSLGARRAAARARRAHELDEALGAAERARAAVAGPHAVRVAAPGPAGRRGRPAGRRPRPDARAALARVAQRVVDLAAQLRSAPQVDEHRRDQHRQRHRQARPRRRCGCAGVMARAAT